MEAKFVQSFQPSTWMDTKKMMRSPNRFSQVSQMTKEARGIQTFMTIQSNKRTSPRCKPLTSKVSSSLSNSQDSAVKCGGFPATVQEYLLLKNKSREIKPYLDGRCIYLVGMMGSGKTTIGKIVAEVLGYSFCDCDVLIEQMVGGISVPEIFKQMVGGISVPEIFKQHGENFFRDKETEALQKVSDMYGIVVSTGGGAVIRPINWKHMRKGVSVWLDIPLECLARRISAVGTDSRPLLHGDSEDGAYSKALKRLSMLLEERGEAYANANARVSLEYIGGKLGLDVDNITPPVIAIEVLEQIGRFLKGEGFAI